jgi:hypothetical protein
VRSRIRSRSSSARAAKTWKTSFGFVLRVRARGQAVAAVQGS